MRRECTQGGTSIADVTSRNLTPPKVQPWEPVPVLTVELIENDVCLEGFVDLFS